MTHPGENDLALLAGGETGRLQRLLLGRHVQSCSECQEKIAGYRELRTELSDFELSDVNWNFLAEDMRANIRLGLEAGACVGPSRGLKRLNLRFVVAFASLLVIVASSLFWREIRPPQNRAFPALVSDSAPVLRLTESGVQVSTGANSLTLLNHHGTATNQTVSAEGDMGARNIDGETGSVTINHVYLQ
jgi:hypothetical protein